MGDTAFFPNGDILLRRGVDTRTVFDNVRAFLRLTNTADLSPTAPQTGLYRCSLERQQCQVFGEKPIDFRSAFSIAIDADLDAVFVSDSSRHVVRKFTLSGIPVGEPAGGFVFPNQLLIHGESLLVADTNNHRVRAVRPDTENFGAEVATHDVVSESAATDGRRWPSHFLRVDDRWWINNMTASMNYGRLHVFDERWRYLYDVPLPDNADPIDMIVLGDQVLVSDWYGDRIHRISKDGVWQGDFLSDELTRVLEESRQARSFYRLAGWLAILVAGGLAAMIVFKFTDWSGPKKTRRERRTAPVGEGSVHLTPDPQKVKELRRAMRLAIVLSAPTFLLIPVALRYAGASIQAERIVLFGLAVLALLALGRWAVSVYTNTSIVLDDRQVTLNVHGGRNVRLPLSRLRYTDHAVAAGDAAVFLGQGKLSLYDRALVVGELDARLDAAQKISPWAMQLKLIQLRHANGLLTVFALAVGIIAGLVYALG